MQSHEREVDPHVAKLTTPEECDQFAINVADKHPELTLQAKRRAVELRAQQAGARTSAGALEDKRAGSRVVVTLRRRALPLVEQAEEAAGSVSGAGEGRAIAPGIEGNVRDRLRASTPRRPRVPPLRSNCRSGVSAFRPRPRACGRLTCAIAIVNHISERIVALHERIGTPPHRRVALPSRTGMSPIRFGTPNEDRGTRNECLVTHREPVGKPTDRSVMLNQRFGVLNDASRKLSRHFGTPNGVSKLLTQRFEMPNEFLATLNQPFETANDPFNSADKSSGT